MTLSRITGLIKNSGDSGQVLWSGRLKVTLDFPIIDHPRSPLVPPEKGGNRGCETGVRREGEQSLEAVAK